MPRLNLTEEEAEQIHKQREVARQHNATYNRALDDVIVVLRKTTSEADVPILQGEIARLRR